MAGLAADLALLVAANDADPDPQSADAMARRATVVLLQAAGRVRTATEQCAAASLLVHSERPAEVEVAQALALAAMATERLACRLAASAFDRLRQLAGSPQKFGTQVVATGTGQQLWPVDPATTDSERAKWDVPPLAELQRRCAAGERA